MRIKTPSGMGLHLIFRDVVKPEWSQNRRDFVELDERARFLTVSGGPQRGARCDR